MRRIRIQINRKTILSNSLKIVLQLDLNGADESNTLWNGNKVACDTSTNVEACDALKVNTTVKSPMKIEMEIEREVRRTS